MTNPDNNYFADYENGLIPNLFVEPKMFFVFGRLLALLIRVDGACPKKIHPQIWHFVLRAHTMTDQAIKQLYEHHEYLCVFAQWMDELKPYVQVDLSKPKGSESIDKLSTDAFEQAKMSGNEESGQGSDGLKAALKVLYAFRENKYIVFKYFQLQSLENKTFSPITGDANKEFKFTNIKDAFNYSKEVFAFALYKFKRGIAEIRRGMEPLVDVDLFVQLSDQNGFMKLVNPSEMELDMDVEQLH